MTGTPRVPRISPEITSLVDRASHAVRQAILDGRLRPGQTLSISRLAAELGASPSPVREALQRLAGQGLVQLRAGRTAVVAPLALEDLREIYRTRVLLEVDAVRRAAPHLTPAQLELANQSFDALAVGSVGTDGFWKSHRRFHSVLMEPVLTPRLHRFVTDLWQASERYVRLVYIETDALFTRSAADRHRPLLAAAQACDPDALAEAVVEHLRHNESELVQRFSETLAVADGDPQMYDYRGALA